MTKTYASSKTSLAGVLLANGTIPLTANWNAGAFSITANSVIIGSAINTIALGSSSGGNGTITSTSNATKGKILFGTSAYDEVNNKLSIGATTAYSTFDVNGGSGTYVDTFNLYGTGSGSVYGRISNTNTAQRTLFALGEVYNDTSTPFWIQRYGSTHATSPSGVEIWNSMNGFMKFATNNVERVTILGNGNVGIGTISPAGGKLTVASDVSLYPDISSHYGQLELTGATTPALRLSLGYNTSGDYGFIQPLLNSSGYKNLILNGNGGSVSIGSATVPASSIFNVSSTAQGVLLPRMTTTQRNAIAAPAEGLIVYDTTLHKLFTYDGTTWQAAW